MPAQQRCRADARELQQLRWIDCAGAQDDLAAGARRDHLATVPDLHAGAALAAVGLPVDDEPGGQGAGPHLEVRAAVATAAQKGFAAVPTPAPFLVPREGAPAPVVAGVEVGRGGYAGLLRRLGKCVEQVPAQALPFHTPFTGAAGALVAVQALEFFRHAG